MVENTHTAPGPAGEAGKKPDCKTIADFIRAQFAAAGLRYDPMKPAVIGDGNQLCRVNVFDALRWAARWPFTWKHPWCSISIPAKNGIFLLRPDSEEYKYECICLNAESVPFGRWNEDGELSVIDSVSKDVEEDMEPFGYFVPAQKPRVVTDDPDVIRRNAAFRSRDVDDYEILTVEGPVQSDVRAKSIYDVADLVGSAIEEWDSVRFTYEPGLFGDDFWCITFEITADSPGESDAIVAEYYIRK
jgi:hypothetical protein